MHIYMGNRFKLFRWYDALSFGLAAVLVTILTTYVTFTGGATMTFGVAALFWVVAASFWFIYLSLVLYRAKWLRKIAFITKHGIAVIPNEFDIDQKTFERIVDETISKWVIATGWANCGPTLNNFCVIFKPYPIRLDSKLGNLAGYVIGDNCVVAYNEALDKTALAHELGHRIHVAWVGYPDMQESHQFMSENNLG